MSETGHNTAAPEPSALWADFRRSRDPGVRRALILHYYPLIRFVVARMPLAAGGAFDRDDQVSEGVFGLAQAIDRFDSERGARFETFAIARIRGAVLDALRRADREPRALRRARREAAAAEQRLGQQLGRGPTVAELRTAHAEAGATRPDPPPGPGRALSLDQISAGSPSGWEPPDQTAGTHERVERRLARAALRQALAALERREREIVRLYYFDECSQEQIARRLQISQRQVGRLLGRARRRLRDSLEEAGLRAAA